MGLIKPFLALSFRTGTYQLGVDSFLAGLRCRNLGFSLIDSGQMPCQCGRLASWRWRRLFSMAALAASTPALAWATCA